MLFKCQIAVIFDCLEEVDTDRVVEYVASLQTEEGSFMGDEGFVCSLYDWKYLLKVIIGVRHITVKFKKISP